MKKIYGLYSILLISSLTVALKAMFTSPVVMENFITRTDNSDLDKRLFNAVIDSDLEEAEKCLKAGADPNFIYGKYAEKLSPLFVATLNNNVEMIRLLIRYGSDINQQTTLLKQTPLFVATDPEIIHELIKWGADVNVMGRPGLGSRQKSILYFAMQQKNIEKINMLIKAGVDLSDTELFQLLLAQSKLSDSIRLAIKYQINLKPEVSRYWNFSKAPLSLREQVLKKLYENYVNGSGQALVELLQNSSTSDFIKNHFSNFMLIEVNNMFGSDMMNFLQVQKDKEILIAKNKVARAIRKMITKKREKKFNIQVQDVLNQESFEREILQAEYVNSMQNLAKQAKLSAVRAKQQEQLRTSLHS